MDVLIIDDEERARNVLKILLSEHPTINNIYEASALLEGVETIKLEKPQIVFLDIDMPGESGLEILNHIDSKAYNFDIIFVTGHSGYAIQAMQLSAIGYILKPVKKAELFAAIERAKGNVGQKHLNKRLAELRETLKVNTFNKIAIPVSDGYEFFKIRDIIMFEANASYCNLLVRTNKKLLVSKPLSHFISMLSNFKFFYQPHRSYYINLNYISKLSRDGGGVITMENGYQAKISSGKKTELLEIIQNLD